MKYSARLPEHNNNVSHEHPLREFFVLVAGTVAVLSIVFVLMGLLVDRAVEYIDPELEASLFGSFYDESTTEPTERERQLQQLLDQLRLCIDVGYPVDIRISESELANAFAMPGGRIVVFSAALDQLKTENGLAFVLAHELGHYQNRDHLRGMGRSAVLLTLSVLMTGAGSDMSSLLTPVFSAESAQYSQSRESAADVTALRALQCHYGHVGGATEFFEAIADLTESPDRGLAHYFASHPEALQRIDDLQELATTLGFESRQPSTPVITITPP